MFFRENSSFKYFYRSSFPSWESKSHKIMTLFTFLFMYFFYFREIAKNAMLRWGPFIYWTLLGIFHGLVFFFGVRFLFSNPALQDNGQVCHYPVIFNYLIKLCLLSIFNNLTYLNVGFWELVIWNNCLHCSRLHCHTKGKPTPLFIYLVVEIMYY